MKKLIIILFFISNVGFAQNEANIWYFGENAGLDFNSGSPVALTNGQLVTDEGCATISNASGNLLFYTDGTTVYNANHGVMVNGTGLAGSFSSTQSAIIIPKPSTPNIYYIFTVDYQAQPNGLSYSEVDMTLDGGLGSITATKNVQLATPVMEKLTAVKHANGNDIWVVAHMNGSAEFLSYLVTSAGIAPAVISNIGNSFSGPGYGENAGYMKASPNGERIAAVYAKFTNGLQVFDFDNATGVLSNLNNIFYDGSPVAVPYGVEFSPSGDLVYVSGSGGVEQFDLTLPSAFDIQLNAVFIANEITDNKWGALQLAPDGKIYLIRSAINGAPDINTISVINNPDTLGPLCDFQQDVVSLGNGIAKSGLPPFIQSFFSAGFQTNNVCLGEVASFNANISQAYDSILWDFGDTNTSTLENPTHTYTAAGDYNVVLSVTSGTQTVTDSKVITIYEQPTATQPQAILICDTDNDGLFNFDLTTQNSAILNGQSTSTFNVLYYASQTDYDTNNPIVDATNFVNDNAYTSQTIIASVINVNNPDCEASTNFNINVFDSPTPSLTIPNLEQCDDTSFGTDADGIVIFDLTQNETLILNGQSATDFTVNYYTDVALTNQIANPSNYQNSNATETVYIQVVNNSNTLCVAQTSFNIEVFALPITNTTALLSQCDDDLDGFSAFNLNEAVDEITTNAVNETITFYETLTEAENETNPITNTTAYINQTVSADAVWVRVENINGCYRTAQLNLSVSTTQIPLTFTRDFYECDFSTDGDYYDGITNFDFSSVNTEIEALFPVGQQLIINYYRNQADALAENNPIVDISNYSNIGYPNTQDIYIRVDSALNNDCLGLGEHITLHVEEVPQATGPIIIEQCDIDNDGTEAIDTSTINSDLLQGQTNVDIVFTDDMGTILPNPLPNPLITGSQSIIATMTNTISLDPDGACSVWTSIDIIIEPGVTASPVADFIVCDDDTDGQFSFDTSTIESTILNGQTGIQVTYQDQNGNNLSSPLPNPFTTSTQTITATVINPTNPMCFAETDINFIVNAQPIANAVQDDIVCDDVLNDGEHLFDLSSYNSQVLNGQPATTFNISYHNNQADADANNNPLSNNYLSTTTSGTIFVRIENSANTTCFDTTSFQIGVSYLPIAYQPDNISICDDETNDGFETINLSVVNDAVLNGQLSAENIISYYLSLDDANNGLNAVNSTFTNTENPQDIFVRLENNSNSNCFSTTQFTITVNEQPVLNMSDQWTICEDDFVEVIADNGYDNYLWSTGETTNVIVVDNPGDYTVTASNTYGSLVCETTKTVTVVESNIATITDIETVDWTQDNNSIIVNVEGDGDYEYSIDGINYQDSNQFTNLIIDDYTIYVRDKNGCGITDKDVYLLYYPNYFTPNGDGIHETWQIFNANKEPQNVIYIYDRYGKLITQLKPNSLGWDGTFNGNPLPTNDYWFIVNRQNGKQYKGHFTLKR